MKDPWFGAKTYGIGIGPKSGAGWAVTGIYGLAMFAVPKIVAAIHGPNWMALGALAVLTIGFAVIVIVTSDAEPRRWRWRWRWGRPK